MVLFAGGRFGMVGTICGSRAWSDWRSSYNFWNARIRMAKIKFKFCQIIPLSTFRSSYGSIDSILFLLIFFG